MSDQSAEQRVAPAVVQRGQPRLDQRGGEQDRGVAPPIEARLDRLVAQIQGLQQQLSALLTRRDEAIAVRASHHVAAIVGAAERSAAQMRAAAQDEVASMRESAMADLRAEAQRLRADAETDAARIRAAAHDHALRVRQKVLIDASSEIQALCGRLTDELEAGAAAAMGETEGALKPTGRGSSRSGDLAPPQKPGRLARLHPVDCIAEVEDAVEGLRTATTTLERSLLVRGRAATRVQSA